MIRYLTIACGTMLLAMGLHADDAPSEPLREMPAMSEAEWQPEPESNRDRDRAEAAMRKLTEALQSGQLDKRTKHYEDIVRYANAPRNRATALIGLANMHFGNGKYERAFKSYKEAVDLYANIIPLDRVLAQEYRIATRHMQQPPSAWYWNVLNERSNNKALEIYDHIIQAAPYSNWAALSAFYAGAVQRWLNNHLASASYYRSMVTRFDDTVNADIEQLVGSARVELARSLKLAAESSDGDSSLITEARGQLQTFLQKFPEHPEHEAALAMLRELNETEAQHLLYLAEFYTRETHARPDASRRYLQRILSDYADTDAAVDAELMLRSLNRGGTAPAAAPGEDTTPSGTAMPAGDSATSAASASPSPPERSPQGKEGDKWLLPIQDL